MKIINEDIKKDSTQYGPLGYIRFFSLQLDFALFIKTLRAQPFSLFSVHFSVCSFSYYSTRLWDSRKRPYQRPYWSVGRHCTTLVLLYLLGQSFNCRSLQVSQAQLYHGDQPCWLLLMTFFSFMCLDMISRITCTITFSVLTWKVYP